MHQLLVAAETTSLLNTAQQNYVVKTMLPGLEQVAESAPAKTLDHAVKQAKTKGIHHGKHTKHKATAPAGTAIHQDDTDATTSKTVTVTKTKNGTHKKKKVKKTTNHKHHAKKDASTVD